MSVWSELGAIVGSEHLRAATRSDAIDAIEPQNVIEPGSQEELARVLKTAAGAGLHVAPRGGGTKLGWGNLPQQLDLILSLSRLSRLREHAWADMTVTLEAGCTVERLQHAVAEHGQRLAVDPLWPERATIGGILSTNDSGSLRVRFGGLRDLIIGITLALPDGTLAKSGGKVVKNVAGYDLPKLATGALGTLGVITEAVFRLHPLPSRTLGVSFDAPTNAAMNGLLSAIQDSKLAHTGAQVRAQTAGTPQVDVRFEGTEQGLEAQVRKLIELAGGLRRAEIPPDAWNARELLWRNADSNLILKLSVLPSQLGWACDKVQSLAATLGLEWKLVAQATGLGWLRLEGRPDALSRSLAELREAAEGAGGSLVMLHCPLELKRTHDVWGSCGDSASLMRRVKAQFDPAGVLNPGRFAGGI